MNSSVVRGLTTSEKTLVMQTKKDRLAELDEDELLDLHRLVRRKRNKYVKLYRRDNQERIQAHGTRDKDMSPGTEIRDRAELFEDRLAVVSLHLAAAARRSADDLRTERLDATRAGRSSGPGTSTDGDGRARRRRNRADHDRRSTNPGRKKRDASSVAQGAARQAKRDSRGG